MEVGSLVDDLDKWKKNLTDEEEYELEKWEKEYKIKLNQKIKKFSEAIQDVAKSHKFNIEFDIPYTDLAFDGAPGRSLVKIMPTLNCLVNLTEQPFFVRAVSNIELIYFEWVHFSIKNFDMAIIYKDFITFEWISSIPSD